jgi:hypothetical protein
MLGEAALRTSPFGAAIGGTRRRLRSSRCRTRLVLTGSNRNQLLFVTFDHINIFWCRLRDSNAKSEPNLGFGNWVGLRTNTKLFFEELPSETLRQQC